MPRSDEKPTLPLSKEFGIFCVGWAVPSLQSSCWRSRALRSRPDFH